MNTDQTVRLIRHVCTEHESLWKDRMPRMRKFRDMYLTQYYKDMPYDREQIRVETPDGHSHVEAFVSALFSRAPAVEVAGDVATEGEDPQMVRTLSNRFLQDTSAQLENATRLALIYPNSFIKIGYRDSDNVLDQVSVRAISPWDVIVDRDACIWEDQRYVAHVYYMNVPEARKRFGNKVYKPCARVDYWDEADRAHNTSTQGSRPDPSSDLPDEFLSIKVVEFYDLVNDQVYYWSPNYQAGEKLLEKGPIAVRTYDDRPLPCIAPLYYERVPDSPMDGMSALARIYDQLVEKNVLRSFWANAVRRDSRQYLYRKEAGLDEEQLAKVTAGIDGAMIGVDAPSLEGLIAPVPVVPMSNNFDRYLGSIERDLNNGSNLAEFARGQATRATATEVAVLQEHTNATIAKLAKERDAAIEYIALLYTRILVLLTDDDDVASPVVEVDGEARIVTPSKLDGKLRYFALDAAETPVSRAMKRARLIELFPILQGLGIPPENVKKEIVRLYDLPESFLEEPTLEPALAGPPEGPAAPVAPVATSPLDALLGGEGEGI